MGFLHLFLKILKHSQIQIAGLIGYQIIKGYNQINNLKRTVPLKNSFYQPRKDTYYRYIIKMDKAFYMYVKKYNFMN